MHFNYFHIIIIWFITSACSCNIEGSSNDICDTESGMCDCLNNVVGLNCSECAENYWGFSSGGGCKECSCNMIGMQNDSIVFV